jgi:transposase
MVHASCWAHAKRKFFQALELNPKDQRAVGTVAQMDKLFEIDRKAREQGLSREDRHALLSFAVKSRSSAFGDRFCN